MEFCLFKLFARINLLEIKTLDKNMEKTKIYYFTNEENNWEFEKFWQLANFLHRDASELWQSYIAGDEDNIHTVTKYTDFRINEGENFSGNRRRYFEDLVEHEAKLYYDKYKLTEWYLTHKPDADFISHLVRTAFDINNRIDFIGDYVFIVLPKRFCSIVTTLSEYDKNSEDIGYYYMKKVFDCVIKSIKNSEKYPAIRSKIFYEFEPWEYIDSLGNIRYTHWSQHYSDSLEKQRLK